MAHIERRRIDELIALYRLEPRVRDVFVEGDFDRRVLNGVCLEAERSSASVYVIDVIDVDADCVKRHGQETSNRGRVIALALELSEKLEHSRSVSATCIVDTDFDEINERKILLPLLLYTDYTCMEMYFVDFSAVRKFFAVFVGQVPPDATITALFVVIVEAFLIRLARSQLCPSLPWITLDRCCEVSGGQIRFDRDEFLQRLFMQLGLLRLRGDFEECMTSYRERLGSDLRNQMHGHDLIEVLGWYVGKINNDGRLRDRKIVERALSIAQDYRNLVQFPMFQRLMERIV